MIGIGDIFSKLLKTIARSRMALAGGAMATVLFPLLLVSATIDLMGWVENPYFSFMLYLALSPLLVFAILLTIVGIYRSRGRVSTDQVLYSFEFFRENLPIPERYSKLRRRAYLYTILASLFLFFLGVVATASHKYSTSVSFCATFCHKAMAPAYITYSNSPHSQVPCIACHAGKNSTNLRGGQLIGLQQLWVTLTDSYSRPLKTPANRLRPSRETCEECHWPEKFHGHSLRVIDKFLADKANSHVQTALLLKIGSGGQLGRSAQGIHWHTSKQHRLFFESTDEERREISRVTLLKADGSSTTYYRKGAPKKGAGVKRLMDCIDCHNRPTHFILSPENALDNKLLADQIPAELPYIKRQALAAITQEYGSTSEALQNIEKQLRQWYAANQPELTISRPGLLDQAIRNTQQAYSENIFPEMKVRWDTYPDFIGHDGGTGGCFRCHDGVLANSEGKTISKDCKFCHIILSENHPVDKVMQIITGGKGE